MPHTYRVILALLVLGALVLLCLRWNVNSRPRIKAYGPRSRKPDDSYQATNAIAKLLLEVLDLRERAARWPAILKTINPEDVPVIRTVLLELRWLHVDSPDKALMLIERACIESKRSGETPTRLELLEIAKSLADPAVQSSQ